jgi:hypothetical protein
MDPENAQVASSPIHRAITHRRRELAARMPHGVPSVIVSARRRPALKIENTKALGAEVV